MALPYANGYDLAADWNFVKRVVFALGKIAGDIYSEVNTTQGHAARAAYATKVAQNPQSFAPQVAQVIVSNATIVTAGTNAATTDQNVYDCISAAFNLLAGA